MRNISDKISKVRIPPDMQHLHRDVRGYPIPDGVFLDLDGRPHFAINDEAKRQDILFKDVCGICGKPLKKLRFFVGGPLSALHPKGLYIDPPMHGPCARYALRVCPYLAAPSYARRIGDATLDKTKVQPGIMGFIDQTMIPERPEIFCLVGAEGQTNISSDSQHGIYRGDGYIKYVKPLEPYKVMEFWKHGKMVLTEDALNRLIELYSSEPEANPPNDG